MLENKIVIRNAGLEDAQAIQILNRDALGYLFDLNRTRERLQSILKKPDTLYLVADLQDQVVGYAHACGRDYSYNEHMKELMAIAVNPNCQGKGVGKQLLLAVEKWAKENGAVALRFVSGFDREGAHSFYEAMSYEHRKNQKNFIKYFNG